MPTSELPVPVECEGFESEAMELMSAIEIRYGNALSEAVLKEAGGMGRKFATAADVQSAAFIVAESNPEYIRGQRPTDL